MVILGPVLSQFLGVLHWVVDLTPGCMCLWGHGGASYCLSAHCWKPSSPELPGLSCGHRMGTVHPWKFKPCLSIVQVAGVPHWNPASGTKHWTPPPPFPIPVLLIPSLSIPKNHCIVLFITPCNNNEIGAEGFDAPAVRH